MVLKFLEKSCAYVFDKSDFNFDYEIPPAFDCGRPSNVCNEDDFDYAIELKEHEEYREVAAKSSNIVDFTDENIEKAAELVILAEKEKANERKRRRRSSVSKGNRRASTASARRRRRESLESIATFSSETRRRGGDDTKRNGDDVGDGGSDGMHRDEEDISDVENQNSVVDGDGDEEGESGEEGSESGSDEYSDSEEDDEDEDEDEDEEVDPSKRESFLRLLKAKNFHKKMFQLNRRKQWVLNHARR